MATNFKPTDYTAFHLYEDSLKNKEMNLYAKTNDNVHLVYYLTWKQIDELIKN